MMTLLATISDILPPSTWENGFEAASGPAGALRHVGIGELKIGGRSEQLKALLGSCVGIAFLWKKRGRYGLAHCLLPETDVHPWEPGARYVSQAVPSLLRLMGASAADYADIEVVVAGGGMLLDRCSSRFQIGRQNADAARKHLGLYGLNVLDCRVGGQSGRTLTIDCATGGYRIEEVAVHHRESHHAHA
ncbi:MAG TPA: chemotaxis protein CheD [Duganella sp.]|jgi:chemotaxis protein CheD|uniref:chemotaxis protein CheD n=1 Tax=Duganella sp. TaxID=1904440 RepID=UPI002ED018EB